ncbi:Exostosin family protein [Melia azedarach]|uniref:Exostosin family protein n=1 Tax=Melia azedarach TaxID=155640 RepID=A0ACC1X9F7_MELAZ|nr:Exostosin family protein [Melia azedarach]
MENCRRYFTPAISLFCAFSIVFVLILSGGFLSSSFKSFPIASKFKFEVSVPTAALQRTVSPISDHQFRAVRFTGSSGGLEMDRLRNSTDVTVIQKQPRKSFSKKQELNQGLARARASIRKAALNGNGSSIIIQNGDDFVPDPVIYRNPSAFYQSYVEMERRFKVYVYREGEVPMTHYGPCKDLYTIEGRFISEIEHGAKRFKTSDPDQAHVYYLPFSVTWMVKYLYKPQSYNLTPLKQFVADYVRVVSSKYPFWNRTSGADHFMLACHDWGPHASRGNSQLYNASIRVLCNANCSEGFNPQKDVTLPEIRLYAGVVSPKLLSPPPFNAPRPYLGFFAGGLHGQIRQFLLQHWKERDNDLKVFEYLPKDLDYFSFMIQSRFCLCPSGYEVASPRIVESIYAECVPVILSENYVLPFSDVLRWEAFSIEVKVSDIPRLKEVLMAVPEEKYKRLKENLKAARRHFELNQPAKRFDVFHMILHSIWLRRLNMRLG